MKKLPTGQEIAQALSAARVWLDSAAQSRAEGYGERENEIVQPLLESLLENVRKQYGLEDPIQRAFRLGKETG